MTLVPPKTAKGCPPAYNGCRCSCHRVPGILHVVACCRPTKGPLLNMSKEWFEKRAREEVGDPTTGVLPPGVKNEPA